MKIKKKSDNMHCDKSCNLIEIVIKLIKILFNNNINKKSSHNDIIFQTR